MKLLGLQFPKSRDAGFIYEAVVRFADEVRQRLQPRLPGTAIERLDAHSFIYIIAALSHGDGSREGRKGRKGPTHPRDLSGDIGDIKNDDLSEIEREGEEIGDKPLDEVRREALAHRPIGPGQVIKLGLQKVRKESQRQKGRIRQLEDYKCQVCGFSIEYVSASGKKKKYIEIDHILDKADGFDEEVSNLWALCPNCHMKKTLRVIEIDVETKAVRENGRPITIRDNHLWNALRPWVRSTADLHFRGHDRWGIGEHRERGVEGELKGLTLYLPPWVLPPERLHSVLTLHEY